MQTKLITRLSALTALAVGLALAAAGCGETSNVSNIAGHSGPGGQSDVRSSGVGPGGHQPAVSNTGVGPLGAGPAGSQ